MRVHFYGKFIGMCSVKVNAKNLEGKTALDIFEMNMPNDKDAKMILCRAGTKKASAITNVMILPHFLQESQTSFESFISFFGIRDESTRNMILLVATLIATATYQCALSPPGGFWQDDCSSHNSTIDNSTSIDVALKPHRAGNMILSGSHLHFFMVLNSTAFLTSVGTIWFTAVGSLPDTLIIYSSVAILCFSYIRCSTTEFPFYVDDGGLGKAGSMMQCDYTKK